MKYTNNASFSALSKLLTLFAVSLFVSIRAQGVAINSVGVAADSSAILDVSSTVQGFLPPRMSTVQRDAIVNPADGLLIFNLSTGCPNYYINGQWQEWCGNGVQPYAALYAPGTVFCGGVVTAIVDVINPATGKTWMDRNLGATQVAMSSTDAAAYGDLYQWGRGADGHQCRTSSTTSTLSSTDQPVHGSFILAPNAPNDWRSPQNTSLWQGVNGVNNPCPAGYRLPSDVELNAEVFSWNSNNSAGAFASPLKLSLTGYRELNGMFDDVGVIGRYWSATVSNASSRRLRFLSNGVTVADSFRAYGFSVRCIKN